MEKEEPSTNDFHKWRTRIASWASPMVDTSAFNTAALLSILGNAIVLGLDTYRGLADHRQGALSFLHALFLALFGLEVLLRAAAQADRPRAYFRDPWNILDLILLTGALLPVGGSQSGALRLLRLARILRAARMMPQVRLIASAIGHSLPGTLGFLSVGGIVLYLYAMVGWMLFGVSDAEHYGSVGRASLTLFLLVTLDGIGEMVRSGMDITIWTVPYYVSFVLFASFVLVNTLIGVVINSLDEARADDARLPAETDDMNAITIRSDHLESHATDLRRMADALDHAANGKRIQSP
ncbi:ion transporter [Streptomyces sp. NPDC001941]|uniref:ion transporter n=1 Tax=Streptomyces sp. NPDC001941 TaxID=3154659 RepID=UPI00332B5634